VVTLQELEQEELKQRGIASKRVPQRRIGSGVTRADQRNVLSQRAKAEQNIQEIKKAKTAVTEQEKERQRQETIRFFIENNKQPVRYSGLNREDREYVIASRGEFARAKPSSKDFIKGSETTETRYEIVGTGASGGSLVLDKKTGEVREVTQSTYATSKPASARELLAGQSFAQQEIVLRPEEKKGFIAQRVENFNTKYENANAKLFTYTGQLPTAENIKIFREVKGKGLEYSFANFVRGTSAGAYTGVREKPLKTIGFGAIGFGTIALGSSVGSVITKTGNKYIVKGGYYVGKTIGAVGLGTYAGVKTYEVIKIPSAYGRGGVIGQTLSTEIIPSSVGAYAGFKTVNSVKGYVRTINREELPSNIIVAPEYPAQQYPKIKKGQTACELLEEFNTAVLPTEVNKINVPKISGNDYKPISPELRHILNRELYIKGPTFKDIPKQMPINEITLPPIPRMFTASPVNYAKKTEALPGSSEFLGLYGAPRLSPKFLRLKGSNYKPFGVSNIFETGSFSTAIRTTPKGIEFTPFVSYNQKTLSPHMQQLKFFGGGNIKVNKKLVRIETGKPLAEYGTAYIAYIKTEKEAILTVGTPLLRTGKSFYFKFDGYRIPINEYKTVPVGTKGAKTLGQITQEQSGYGYYGQRRPLINVPSAGYSSQGSSYRSSYSIKLPSYSSSMSYKSYSPRSYGSPSRPYYPSSPPPSSPPSSPPPSYPSYPSSPPPSSPPSSPPPSYPTYGPPNKPPRSPPLYPSFSKGKGKTKQTGGFNVFVRRFGKFKLVGSGLTFRQASTLGQMRVKQSLGRTFRITGSGKRESLGLERGTFRTPKSTSKLNKPFTFIQIAPRSLSSTGERREIKAYARRR